MSNGGDGAVVERVLRAFADLAGRPDGRRLRSADPAAAAWVTVPLSAYTGDDEVAVELPPAGGGDRLEALAKVRGDAAELRLGFLWMHAPGRYIGPLISVPVAEQGRRGKAGSVRLDIQGAAELWDPDLPSDIAQSWHDLVAELADRLTVPAAGADIDDLAADFARAVGAADVPVRAGDRPLHEWRERSVVARSALYLRDVARPLPPAAEALAAWAGRDLRGTALAAVYDPASIAPPSVPDPPVDWLAPTPLDAAQRAAVAATGRDALTVVSGPPGTGKSQTVAAIALTAVARGERVLVVAPSDAAAGAVQGLLLRAGAATPVFISGRSDRRRRHALLARLSSLGAATPDADDARAPLASAMTRYRTLRAAVEEQLAVEAASAPAAEADELLARHDAPGFFDSDADHDRLGALAARAGRTDGWWWTRRRASGASDRLRAAARAAGDVDVDRLRDALAIARRVRAASVARAAGGLTLDAVWPALLAADDDARHASAAWVDRRSMPGGTGRHSEVLAIVAASVRNGPRFRREALAAVPGRTLTEALPLWISTLGDVDLLPPTPHMFDLVVIDEAAQIDQPSAAPALARASRAAIVGDPLQLRHVSFLADDRVRVALAEHGLDTDPLLAGRLDLRRMTLYDAAAAVAPVHLLDTHYRSAPHLIGFSARRFYEGRLVVATATPDNDRADHIDVVELDGSRDAGGVNAAEVAWIIEHLQRRAQEGRSSIGVLTPFRAQADAIERAVMRGFTWEELDRLDLRIGTVHAFQGCERDEVVVSLAATARSQLAFVNDPNLFNVMVTRARDRMIVLASMGDDATGLTSELLRYAADASAGVASRRAAAGWTRRVDAELERIGVVSTAHYPFGRDDIDVVVAAPGGAFAVECTVHRDGPAAHVDRHLAMRRRGWIVRDFFASRWEERLAEVAIRLSLAAGAPTASN